MVGVMIQGGTERWTPTERVHRAPTGLCRGRSEVPSQTQPPGVGGHSWHHTLSTKVTSHSQMAKRNCHLQALIKRVFTTSKSTFNLNLIKGWCKSPHWRPHLPPACEFMPQCPSLRISLLCLRGWLFNSFGTPIQTHTCPGPTGRTWSQVPGHWSGPQFICLFVFLLLKWSTEAPRAVGGSAWAVHFSQTPRLTWATPGGKKKKNPNTCFLGCLSYPESRSMYSETHKSFSWHWGKSFHKFPIQTTRLPRWRKVCPCNFPCQMSWFSLEQEAPTTLTPGMRRARFFFPCLSLFHYLIPLTLWGENYCHFLLRINWLRGNK